MKIGRLAFAIALLFAVAAVAQSSHSVTLNWTSPQST